MLRAKSIASSWTRRRQTEGEALVRVGNAKEIGYIVSRKESATTEAEWRSWPDGISPIKPFNFDPSWRFSLPTVHTHTWPIIVSVLDGASEGICERPCQAVRYPHCVKMFLQSSKSSSRIKLLYALYANMRTFASNLSNCITSEILATLNISYPIHGKKSQPAYSFGWYRTMSRHNWMMTHR